MPIATPRALRLIIVAAIAVAAISPVGISDAVGASSSSPQRAGAEVLWDSYGVPHIFAPDDAALGRAFGWAQMQGHADLILTLFGQSRGRAAEYWGGSENEASDVWVRRMGIPANSRAWYRAQDPAFRSYLDAFVAGMNAWGESHRAEITDSLEVVLPVTAMDVLAHGQRVLTTTFVTSPERVRAYARPWERGDLKAAEGAGGAASAADSPAHPAGSNAWAVAPGKSASGRAMLLANPHLPWSGLFTWFEAQLVAPGVNVYGATLVGSPVITIGFNDRLGWTHTVNTHDGQDLFELTLEGTGYRWNGAVRPFTLRAETLLVKQKDGTQAKRALEVKASVHGPVVAERPGAALALRVVGLDRPRAWKEWWEMGRARTLTEFRAALGAMQMPMFTVMYADRDGHIMHLFGGLTPVRSRGDWDYWSGVVRGDSSATLWTRTHTLAELPSLTDPATGWLQNANDPPWTSTLPIALDPSKYPPYMAPRGMAFRPQRSARLVGEPGKLDFEELVRRKHDTRMELADRIVAELVAGTRQRGSDLAKRGADVLERWDRTTDADSRGGVLFDAWWRELARRSRGASPFVQPWDPARPLETPTGIADPATATRALETAAADVEKRFGALDVPWGMVHRLRRDSVDLPANGGSGMLGVFRVIEFGDPDADQKRNAVFGDSFVAAVEFGTPVKARTLLGYGNWSQPGKHRTDQLALFSRKELREAWLTREQIEAHLEKRETITAAATR